MVYKFALFGLLTMLCPGVGGIDKKGERKGVMGVFEKGRFVGDVKDGNGTTASRYYNITLNNLDENPNKNLLLPVGAGPLSRADGGGAVRLRRQGG